MYPILFHIGPLSVYSYGFMLALAFLISTMLAKRKAKEAGFSPNLIPDLATYFLIGGIIGARIFYVILNWEEYRHSLLQIVMVQKGGLCFYGALFGGFLAGIIFLKKYKLSFSKTADFISPYLALGQAIGRIGCFLRGCCYGKETSFFIRIRFPDELVYRHPTEIYASILNFLVFLFLRSFYRKKKVEGEVFLLYLMLYSAKRFLFDFLRGDLPIIYLGLNLFQLMSIPIFILSLLIFIFRRKYGKKEIYS